MAANEVTITRASQTRDYANTLGLLTRSVAKEIFKKSPPKAVLMQIMMGSQRIVEDNRIFEWYEQDLDPKWITCGVIGGSTTAWTIALSNDDCKLVELGMTIRKNITQVGHITSVTRTTDLASITVDSAATFVVGDKVQVGAGVVEESSAEPTPRTRLPAKITNQVATIRDAWGQSNWVDTDKMIAGKPRQTENRDTCLLEHKIKLDIEAWNSKATATQFTQNSGNINWTSGILEQVVTNRAICTNGNLTWEQLTTVAQEYDRLMDSANPYMFMSRATGAILDIVAFQKTSPNNFQAVGDEFGVHVKKLVLGNKSYKCVIVDHWAYGLGQHILAIDMKHLTLRSTKDQKSGSLRWMIETMRGMDITGVDGSTGCVLSELGVKVENEEGAWMMTGITNAG